MKLYIAEKPELGKAIVAGLGGGQRENGYYTCGSDIVTWCFGHMLSLYDPEDYDEKYKKWSFDHLPIVNIPWKLKPGKDKKEQLKIISNLIDRADSIVNAGDPDPEGQLLVDEILTYVGNKKPVERLLINDNNLNVVKKALSNMRDNAEFEGLSNAALARSVGDQMYGFNLSRAYTLKAQEKGFQGVLSVGRVQTPILGLVVRREREFNAHKKAYYYRVVGDFTFNQMSFSASYNVKEGDTVDDKKRLTDKAQAEQIAEAVKGQSGVITQAITKHKKLSPPLPYNLLKLQSDASRKFGLKPDQTKDITQRLRETWKLITYNRSDCQYLSDEQHEDAPEVIKAIVKTAPLFSRAAEVANPSLKSRAFNSKKVSAHHAIIPTQGTADFDKLSKDEQNIYLLIARSYLAQFFDKQEVDETSLTVKVGEHSFSCKSKIVTKDGWMAIYKNDKGNEETEEERGVLKLDLRKIKDGEQGQCLSSDVQQKETKPLPLYKMDTLLTDLTRVSKYVLDERIKKILIEKDADKAGEHGGIGTPATRDSIIKTLFDRGFLAEKGKFIVSTDLGKKLYDSLPDQARYPDMTALWHEEQKEIEEGKIDIFKFLNGLSDYVSGEVSRIGNEGINVAANVPKCPECKKPLRLIKKGKDSFWGCTGYPDCKKTFKDKGGQPDFKGSSVDVSRIHKCKVCGKGLVRRKSKNGKGYWWGCSGFSSGCKQTYPDIKGKPNYQNKGVSK